MGAGITCGICESERATLVNAFLQANRTPHWIEKQMKELGAPTKAETVTKHLNRCLQGKVGNIDILGRAANGEKVNPNADFAAAIRAEANRKLADGTLQVTANHGLAAQALIDRRAERAADRRLLVELAGLLSGAITMDGPPEDLIEGEFTEVTSDESSLAPVALIASGE